MKSVGSIRDASERGLALGFLRQAVAALLASGVFVLLVAIARTPLVELVAGRDYLYTALVAHVVFALDLWLLSFVAGLWVLTAARMATPLSPGVAGAGKTLSWAGVAFVAAVPLAGQGRPVMADYIPILMHPLFVLGLALYFVGIAFVAVNFLASLWGSEVRRRRMGTPTPPLEALALGFGAAGYLVAIGVFVLAALRWGVAEYASLAWGTGHLFQLVNAAALIAVWLMLVPARGRLATGLLRVGFLGFVPSIVVAVLVPAWPLHWEQISLVYWAGLGVPLGVAWLVVLGGLIRQRLQGRLDLGETAFLLFSLALFAVGGLIALPGMGNDTRVTAHYHATVGAVTMIFMGLTYRLLPRLDVSPAWRGVGQVQSYLYGGGLFLLVGGLFWAGEAGTARKIFEAISTNPSLLPAATLFGLGALVTIVGGIVFVAGAGLSLLNDGSEASASAQVRIEPARARQAPSGN